MSELEKQIASFKLRIKICKEYLLKREDDFSRGYSDASDIALKIIDSLQAENQRIIEKHDRYYKNNCEEEAFRLKCYREELEKVEAENQELRSKLEEAVKALKEITNTYE